MTLPRYGQFLFDDDSIDKGTGVLDQYQCQVSRPSCGKRPLTYPSKHVLHLLAINTLQHSSNPGLQYIVRPSLTF